MKTYLKQKEKFFQPKRLIWDVEGPKGPEAEKPIDIKENEKWDAEKMNKVAERIKNLTLAGGQIEINKDPKKVDAITFRTALKEALAKDPAMKEIKVNNLDLYLIKGLQENLDLKADDKAGMNYNENTRLTKWLQDNKVAKFSIDKGDWLFFDKDGKPVPAQSTLTEAPKPEEPAKPDAAKPDAAKPKSPEKADAPGKVQRFVLSKEVKEAKAADKQKAEDAEKEAQAEAERVKPENLEKVKTDQNYEFNKDSTLADMCFNLALFENKTNSITMGEIESQVVKYINVDPALRGKDNNESFSK
ncbi:hypothetical protein IT411_02250, partial [Candidatus Peregrinibacteria bacterium]|nr:hypothetical protein [Candidatus Peregrinibacteria bacterium]